ncbi:MAG: hypothetical protein LBC02_13595 [Planctomycetaceae bacterium]|nr:hypothetical protein [Planctomycetaceae bacterium]
MAHTTTKQGLKIQCNIDENKYENGIKVTDDELKKINIKNRKFQGDWNYTIKENKKN